MVVTLTPSTCTNIAMLAQHASAKTKGFVNPTWVCALFKGKGEFEEEMVKIYTSRQSLKGLLVQKNGSTSLALPGNLSYHFDSISDLML